MAGSRSIYAVPDHEQHHMLTHHHHWKELSCGLIVIAAVLAAVSFMYRLESQGYMIAHRWASQPWVKVPCIIEDVGVAYRGTCEMDIDITMVKQYKSFKECSITSPSQGNFSGSKLAIDELRWHETFAGRCAARGDYAYRETEEATSTRNLRDSDRLENTEDFQARRLHMHTHAEFEPVRVECENSFLSWAKVRLINSTQNKPEVRCAYQFGATVASLVTEISTAKALTGQLDRNISSQLPSTCWQLTLDDCIVAFSDLDTFMKKSEEEDKQVIKISMIFGMCFMLFAICACLCHLKDELLKNNSLMSYESVPTEDLELSSIPLDERITAVSCVASAFVFVDTPPASGPNTARSTLQEVEFVDSTGRHHRYKKNLAADFIKEQSSGGW